MIGISKIQIPSTPRFLEQGPDDLLPHAAALIFEQASMTGFRRGGNVMRQVFPLAARLQDVQNPIEDFSVVGSGAPGPCALSQEPLQVLPLGIRHIGAIGLPSDTRNVE
jgi:hypothetical protein